MACFCSDKKKLDFEYVKKLAVAESLTKKIDIQIYFTFGYDGKTKYYDYEPTNGGRKLNVVEIIRFSEPKSLDLLPNIEFSGFDTIDSETTRTLSAINTITGVGDDHTQNIDLDKKTVEKVKNTKSTKRVATKPIDSDSGTVL